MKLTLVLIVSVAVNTGLFILMDYMVGRDRVRLLNSWETQTIDFVRTPIEDETKTKDRRRKPPPKPEEVDRPKARMDESLVDTTPLPSPIEAMSLTSLFAPGGVAVGARLIDGDGSNTRTVLEGDLIPISKFPPQYPPRASMRNLEGHVKVLFMVRKDGTVRDPVVIESEPSDVFDRSAVEAVSRWRYRPPMIDGVAREVRVTAIVDYNLDD